jgi:hypothetical protein
MKIRKRETALIAVCLREGTVAVFDLADYPRATRACAWSSPIEGRASRRFRAALHMGSIKSPVEMARAAIVAEAKAK